MTINSRIDLTDALSTGKPDDLIGTAESNWLDFKSSPYALDTDKGKFELCKDVAAFANAQGGLLVCGVSAAKQANTAVELADKLQPFPQSRAKIDKYIDTLNEYLRPRVAVSHHWYIDSSRSTADGDNYYLVIEVEPIPEIQRYVIVRRTLNDKEMLVEGLAIPIRHGDRTVYLPSEDAYQLINGGLRARDGAYFIAAAPSSQPTVDVDRSIDILEQLQDWTETPVLLWQSIPPQPAQQILPGLHSDEGVRGGLINQQVLRENGFNFADNLGNLRLHEGGLLLDRRRCALWVAPDGLVTAGAIATTDMLCWAMEQRNQPERINVHVLTEMTLEYFRLVDELILPRVPGQWRHRIVARRFQGDRPRSLGPSETNWLAHHSARPASADSWSRTWPAIGDPEQDAYTALEQLYPLFGLDITTNADVENGRVLMERIRNG